MWEGGGWQNNEGRVGGVVGCVHVVIWPKVTHY